MDHDDLWTITSEDADVAELERLGIVTRTDESTVGADGRVRPTYVGERRKILEWVFDSLIRAGRIVRTGEYRPGPDGLPEPVYARIEQANEDQEVRHD